MVKTLALLGSLVALLLTFGSLGHAGLCFKQMRFVSEREKVEAAVEKALGGGNSLVSVPSRGWEDRGFTFKTPAYASAAEFLAAHPECCRIGPERTYSLPAAAIRDPRVTLVVVQFDVQAEEHYGTERPITVSTNVTVDACGYAYGRVDFFDWWVRRSR